MYGLLKSREFFDLPCYYNYKDAPSTIEVTKLTPLLSWNCKKYSAYVFNGEEGYDCDNPVLIGRQSKEKKAGLILTSIT